MVLVFGWFVEWWFWMSFALDFVGGQWKNFAVLLISVEWAIASYSRESILRVNYSLEWRPVGGWLARVRQATPASPPPPPWPQRHLSPSWLTDWLTAFLSRVKLQRTTTFIVEFPSIVNNRDAQPKWTFFSSFHPFSFYHFSTLIFGHFEQTKTIHLTKF